MAAPKTADRRKDPRPVGTTKHRCGVVPKRRRPGSPWAGFEWSYWRLHDARDLVVGFKRVAGDVTHYVDLREDHWQVTPIEYDSEVRLSGELLSFHYLGDPGESD